MATKAKFVPKQKERKNEEGKIIKIDLYKGTTIDEIIDFLEKHGTAEDKREFKESFKYKVEQEGTGRYYKSGKKAGKEIARPVLKNGEKVVVKVDDPKFDNWLYAKEQFFKKFAPEYLEKKNKKVSGKERMKDW